MNNDNIKVISSEITDRIVTEQDLIRIYDIDLSKWNIVKKIVNTWESSTKDAEGNVKVTPNFQVKLWLENITYKTDLEQIRKDFVEDLKQISPVVPKYSTVSTFDKDSSNLLEINIFDLHLGKIGWDEEVGHTYNLETACTLFENAIEHFAKISNVYSIDRIVLPVGNDFFNSDRSNPFNSTTKGTPQEDDGRWQHIFRTGRQLLVKSVQKLSTIAPVDVIMIPGNHDYERNFYLGDSLEGWFHNNQNVTVDNRPSPRKYYGYGSVLLGYTHGDQEKIANLPLIMAQEVPDLWAKSTYREFHLGHFHHKKQTTFNTLLEQTGVTVRTMSSLSGTDAWHHKRGYIQNKRAGEAIVWGKTSGQLANIYYNG